VAAVGPARPDAGPGGGPGAGARCQERSLKWRSCGSA
jgi:hypothetical protein